VDFFLFPALSNPMQTDPRKRGAIYAYSGGRPIIDVSAKTIALDPTALLTFGVLHQLDRIIGFCDKIVVAHSTLGWLFEEKQRVQFHQPSQIADAKEIKRLLAADDLKEFESIATANSELSNEIGDDLSVSHLPMVLHLGKLLLQRRRREATTGLMMSGLSITPVSRSWTRRQPPTRSSSMIVI